MYLKIVMLTSPGFFYKEANLLVLIRNEFTIGKKYVHVYSAGPCCHICLHIYEGTIYKHCYCYSDPDGNDLYY